MKIAIGTDHRGFALKNGIIGTLTVQGGMPIEWLDVGCFSATCCDYPIFAQDVVKKMRDGSVEASVLLCGTGAGMGIAANRFSGIYAAVVWNVETARLAREHDNANILVLPSDYSTLDLACQMIDAWLSATFEGGRHQRRIDLIDSCKAL